MSYARADVLVVNRRWIAVLPDLKNEYTLCKESTCRNIEISITIKIGYDQRINVVRDRESFFVQRTLSRCSRINKPNSNSSK